MLGDRIGNWSASHFIKQIIGSMHPSENDTIAVFQGEKGESKLDEKENVFTTFNLFQHAW